MQVVDPQTPGKAAHTQKLAPPPPAEHVTPPTLEWEDELPVRRKSGAKLPWLLAFSACMLAVALGYAAFQAWTNGQHALTLLTSTSAQLRSATQKNTRDAASLADLQKQLAQSKQNFEQADIDRSDLKTRLGAAEARLGELEAQSSELAEHLSEFRSLTSQFQRMIDSGKLQISYRRGRMIVELPAAVLFASGSADLSDDGRKALHDIAGVLRKVPNKRFIVGGHTDDVPIGKTGSTYSSNWALSAARAVKVTEALIEAGLRGNHLVAAGFSEFDPVASNGNDKGRQRNRRIEIVLEPELGSLPNTLAELKKTDQAAAKAAPKKPPSRSAAKKLRKH